MTKPKIQPINERDLNKIMNDYYLRDDEATENYLLAAAMAGPMELDSVVAECRKRGIDPVRILRDHFKRLSFLAKKLGV